MTAPELRYLAIDWAGPGIAARITVAPEPIVVERVDNGGWRAETQIFNDALPWIGLRAGDVDEHPPELLLPSGKREKMLRVQLSGQHGWWVEYGRWDGSSGRHLSALHRESGRVHIRAGQRMLVLDHMMGGAGRLDDYLADFRNEFVWLVLSAGAKASGSLVGSGGPGFELADAVERFAAAARNAMAAAAPAIREVAGVMPVTRVRPSAATFRAHARNPAARMLPSRCAVESLDTSENRYLRWLIENALRAARAAAVATRRSAERFAVATREEAERAERLANTLEREINPVVWESQYEAALRRLRSVTDYSDGACEGETRSYAVTLTNSFGRYGFFYEPLNTAAEAPSGMRYRVLRLPDPICGMVGQVRAFNRRFVFVGRAKCFEQADEKGKSWHIEMQHVSEVRTDFVAQKEKARQRLIRSDWKVAVSAAERRELLAEARTAKARASANENHGKALSSASGRLLQATRLLLALSERLAEAGVLASAAFPMGQTFLTNPRYAASLRAWRALEQALTASGIGLDTLDRLDEVGVLHASALYERWCIVKMISVVVEEFGFAPVPGWDSQLVRAILDRTPGASVELRREGTPRTVRIEYQASLSNGRRPDFIVRIINDGETVLPGPALVLDAKFRTRWSELGAAAAVREMFRDKDYGCDGGRVFIMHPVPGAIAAPLSPLEWGPDCDYGHYRQRHRRGSILFAVDHDGRTRMNFKRLITMALQSAAGLPPMQQDDWNQWLVRQICAQCGAPHGPGDLIEHLRSKKKDRIGESGWDLTCRVCAFEVWLTWCYECKTGSPIFKNGTGLTYHCTVADQITNVMCPTCGAHATNTKFEHSRD